MTDHFRHTRNYIAKPCNCDIISQKKFKKCWKKRNKITVVKAFDDFGLNRFSDFQSLTLGCCLESVSHDLHNVD